MRDDDDEGAASVSADEAPDDLLDVAIDWLRNKWGADKACPYCGGTAWSVGKRLPFDVITVTCMNCATIVMVDLSPIRAQAE